MVFQTNQIDLSKFINLFSNDNKKVNNLNIFTVIISKKIPIASLISSKINYQLFILEWNLNLFKVNKVLLLNITLVIIFFLRKEAVIISPREERQNLNITKYGLF